MRGILLVKNSVTSMALAGALLAGPVAAVPVVFAPAASAATPPTVQVFGKTGVRQAKIAKLVTVTWRAQRSRTPVIISWGDGRTTRVKDNCQPKKNWKKCTVSRGHSWTRSGTYTVSASWNGRVIGSETVTVLFEKPLPTTSNEDAPLPVRAEWRTDMLAQVNQLRAEAGVGPVSLCPRLNSIAQQHADAQMATLPDHPLLGHVGADGSTPAQRGVAGGYGTVGENVVWSPGSVTDAVVTWRRSPGHYANMINPNYVHVGFGATRGPDTPWGPSSQWYWVQNFGMGGTCEGADATNPAP